MVKGAYILNDREQMIELVISQQVVTADFYNSIKNASPPLAKMMLDKFKEFLKDDYFTSFERQSLLMQFFEEHNNLDTIEEVLNSINDSEQKEDYTKVIMEWTYAKSDDIRRQNLAKVDGKYLCDAKSPKTVKLQKPNAAKEFIQKLVDLSLNEDGDDYGRET